MSRRVYIYLLAVVAVIIAVAVFFMNGDPDLPLPKNRTIVAFGDSLVLGIGSTEGHDFVSVLEKKTGRLIINMGKSGDTTEEGLARVGDVIAEDPGIVVLLLGGNDYLRRIPKETTFDNLDKIVSRLEESGARVVLLGIRGGLLRDNYASDFGDFAESHSLIFVENVLDGLIGNREYMSDEIHPNDRGYEKIAGRVLPALRRADRTIVVLP